MPPEPKGHYQDSRRVPQGSIKRQLAHKSRIAGNLLSCGPENEPYSNREIQPAPILGQFSRGQTDGNMAIAGRELQARVSDRGTHPLPGLLHGGGRQSNQEESGLPIGDIHLNLDWDGIHTAKNCAEDGGWHPDRVGHWRLLGNVGC
jgi:hypothetical protein